MANISFRYHLKEFAFSTKVGAPRLAQSVLLAIIAKSLATALPVMKNASEFRT